MGTGKSRPYVGRGSTIETACGDLQQQLCHHISSRASVKLSQPLPEHPLSPRAKSPRYAGPYVAMALINNDGCEHNVRLERDPKTKQYYAIADIRK